VEEGQEPNKRRECTGDVGTPENQAEGQKIDRLNPILARLMRFPL